MGQVETALERTTLAVFTTHRVVGKLLAIPGVRRHQMGDTEARMLFPASDPACLRAVFSVVRPRVRLGMNRTTVIPLVFQGFDWTHGVFLGSAMRTETTAAITGKVGVVRRDPMAMLPFCGYNMGDYFAHWLSMQQRLTRPPRLFRVNWFRRDADGKFLWPGYGENVRVLKWMVERIHGGAPEVDETPIGWIPKPSALDTGGLNLSDAQLREALRCDAGEWLQALGDLDEFYGQFGSRLPRPIATTLAETRRRFSR